MRTKLSITFVLAALTLLAVPVSAAVTVDTGSHQLNPNQAGQIISVLVSTDSSDQVAGLNFYFQIDDGQNPTITPAPAITSVDIIGVGTIFNGNNTGQTDFPFPPYFQGATTTTNSGSVLASGTLAWITLDTTGVTIGSWDLNISNTLNGDTDFATFPGGVTLNDGSLSIIPEPASLVLIAAGLGTLLIRRR